MFVCHVFSPDIIFNGGGSILKRSSQYSVTFVILNEVVNVLVNSMDQQIMRGIMYEIFTVPGYLFR